MSEFTHQISGILLQNTISALAELPHKYSFVGELLKLWRDQKHCAPLEKDEPAQIPEVQPEKAENA
jgi:hypothetical protein